MKTAAVRAMGRQAQERGRGIPSIENAFGLLRQVLGSAVEDSRIPRNPCDGVKLPKRSTPTVEYLSHGQVVALASRC